MSEKKTIQHIDIYSSAKLSAAIMGAFGLIAGALYAFGGLALDALVSMGWIVSPETPGLSYGTLLAFGALIAMPLMAAVYGAIVGVCSAWVYNIAARFVGGIAITFSTKDQ